MLFVDRVWLGFFWGLDEKFLGLSGKIFELLSILGLFSLSVGSGLGWDFGVLDSCLETGRWPGSRFSFKLSRYSELLGFKFMFGGFGVARYFSEHEEPFFLTKLLSYLLYELDFSLGFESFGVFGLKVCSGFELRFMKFSPGFFFLKF